MQNIDQWSYVTSTRNVESSLAFVVLEIRIGATREQQFGHSNLVPANGAISINSPIRGDMERCATIVVRGIQMRTLFDQKPRGFNTPVEGRLVQW